MTKTMRWQDWITVLLGVWLVASPWALGFAANDAALWNALVFGAGIVLLEIADVYFPDPWPERASFLVGLWVAISPMVLGFTGDTAATLSTTLSGAVVVVLAAWTDWMETREKALGH
jgi:hypothetical protein